MPYNLLSEAWLPVRRRDGEVVSIRPAEIVAGLGTDREAVEPAWPRPDFDIATYEFLIGLLFAACPPQSHRAWRRRWNAPPSVADLDAAFEPFSHAFNLDGDGPRFLQDFEPFEIGLADKKATPIERLMIDAAGGNAVKLNKDLQVHRDRYPALGLPGAAMALYALQQFAPPGGSGNRASMRGGGPMTALALPAEGEASPSLWELAWANTPLSEGGPLDPQEAAMAFPWLAETRSSKNGETVSSERQDAHSVQAFFGMPRRIRLIFRDADEGAPTRCALMGEETSKAATGFAQKPHGVNYGVWMHPLTPYYQSKEGSQPLPLHPKEGRFGYRDWIGVAIGSEDGLRSPARSLEVFRRERAVDIGLRNGRMLVAGYATSNMDALDYVFAEQPLHVAATPERVEALDDLARQMAAAGEAAMKQLRRAVRRALFGKEATVDLGSALLDDIRTRFYDATEPDFHRILGEAALAEPAAQPPRAAWIRRLESEAMRIFTVQVLEPMAASPDRFLRKYKDSCVEKNQAVEAHRDLRTAFHGTKKEQGVIAVALGLAWTPPRDAKTSEQA